MIDTSAFDFDADYGRDYDKLVVRVIPGYSQLFQATLAVLRSVLGRKAELLVVGCGTGREIETFAPPEPGWTVTGVDPSIRMIEASASLVKSLDLESRARLVHGTVDDLAARPAYDAATIINVMHFLPDDGAKENLIRSVASRLKEGGYLVLFDLYGEQGALRFELLCGAWRDFVRQRGVTGAAHDRFFSRINSGIAFVSESRIVEICSCARLGLVCRYFAGLCYGGWLFQLSSRDAADLGVDT